MIFLWVYAQQWGCWVIWQFCFQFCKEPPYYSPQWLYQFTFPPTMQESSFSSTSSPVFTVCRLFDDGYSDGWLECGTSWQFFLKHIFGCARSQLPHSGSLIHFPCGMQDLQLQHVGSSSLIRNRTLALCSGTGGLATGPPRRSLSLQF